MRHAHMQWIVLNNQYVAIKITMFFSHLSDARWVLIDSSIASCNYDHGLFAKTRSIQLPHRTTTPRNSVRARLVWYYPCIHNGARMCDLIWLGIGRLRSSCIDLKQNIWIGGVGIILHERYLPRKKRYKYCQGFQIISQLGCIATPKMGVAFGWH